MVADPRGNDRTASGDVATSARRADAVRNCAAITEAALRVLADQPGASMAEIARNSLALPKRVAVIAADVQVVKDYIVRHCA